MTPPVRWLLWAVGLFALVALADIAILAVGGSLANAKPVREAGALVMLMLGAYLLIGISATALFWFRGHTRDAGLRIAATIAFLLAQGLLFALMSLGTLMGTNR
jgi:hypothetical protein